MDVAFVKHAEHDVDHGDGHNQQNSHIAHGILEDLGGALEGTGDGGGQGGAGGGFDIVGSLAEGGAGLEGEGDGDGRQLAGMRNALRAGIGHHFGDGAERHHLTGVALKVDHVQPVGVLLEYGQHLE